MLQRDQERIANLNNIYNCNDVEAIQMLRMRRAPFYALVKTFRERGLLTDSIHTSVEEQVAMFLHVVGHNQRFRVIHNTFRRSTETISRYFQQVLYAIGELRGEMIKPASMNTPTKIKNSYRWFPYFRDCIGAIDGTHVTAKVPRSMSAAFRGRKHYTSQNVLAAVDFDVLAGWEGSAHDASILADNLSRPDGLQIPDGWGEDEFFEEVVSFDEVETGHGVEAGDNDAWKVKRQEWADAMWEARGNTTIEKK
ncbi:hypothetical protein QYE76_012188 [Lolium multiflorum]|uniref:DUF8040 domain-containing protein n=1 Tax=Lolium multiflorum TaxID=4521 RepID=A0AAD8X3Q3_LOLMU|nr:hypothetical protein QYE76_012188 [Lolium multiflorum]